MDSNNSDPDSLKRDRDSGNPFTGKEQYKICNAIGSYNVYKNMISAVFKRFVIFGYCYF